MSAAGDRIVKAAEALGEHFDSVQIFASRKDGPSRDGTLELAHGVGNYFARYGQVRCWLEEQDEKTRHDLRKREDTRE